MQANEDEPEDVRTATPVKETIEEGQKDKTVEPTEQVTQNTSNLHDKDAKKKKKKKCWNKKNKSLKDSQMVKVQVYEECEIPRQEIIPRQCFSNKEEYLNYLATPSFKCPPPCSQKTELRKIRPIPPRINDLALPTKQRMLATLEECSGTLPAENLDHLIKLIERGTNLTPEQAGNIITDRKKRQKKCEKKTKPDCPGKLKKMGNQKPMMDKEAVNCQYAMAEKFVRSILNWKCHFPKNDIHAIAKVILKRLGKQLDHAPSEDGDRLTQQMKLLADVVACWVSGVIDEVNQDQKQGTEREKTAPEVAEDEDTEEETEDEDSEEKEDEGPDADTGKKDKDDEDDEGSGDASKEKDGKELEEEKEASTKQQEEEETEEAKKGTELEDAERMRKEEERDKLELEEEMTSRRRMSAEIDIKTRLDEEEEAARVAEEEKERKRREEERERRNQEEEARKLREAEEKERLEEQRVLREEEAERKREERKRIEEEEQKRRQEEAQKLKDEESIQREKESILREEEAESIRQEEKEQRILEEEKPKSEPKKVTEKKLNLEAKDSDAVFQSDLPFVTFGKVMQVFYTMLKDFQENPRDDPITNRIHRALYEKMEQAVLAENQELTDHMKDVIDVITGKVAVWLRKIISDSELQFMGAYPAEVESFEIRNWRTWLITATDAFNSHVNRVRGKVEAFREMGKITKGDWYEWTKDVDESILKFRKFRLDVMHKAHHQTMTKMGRKIVPTGTAKTGAFYAQEFKNERELRQIDLAA